jgi:hypothetical protein
VIISQVYAAPIDDVWDGCTSATGFPGGSCRSRATCGPVAGTDGTAAQAAADRTAAAYTGGSAGG